MKHELRQNHNESKKHFKWISLHSTKMCSSLLQVVFINLNNRKKFVL